MFIPFKISPGLPLLKQIAADIKHVFAKLPLVTFVISNLTRLMAVVCMKVRFEAKATRVFSFSSPLYGSLSLSRRKILRKTSGARVPTVMLLMSTSDNRRVAWS